MIHRVLLAIWIVLSAALLGPEEPRLAVAPTPAVAATPPPPVGPQPPQSLTARLNELGEAFDGEIGIAVTDLTEGWTADFHGASLLPQQSVSKLWVAMAVLDAVDQGTLRLDDPVSVNRDDMSVFHQPIRAKLGPKPYQTTVGALLEGAIIQSDNAANDILIRLVGGPTAIQAAISARRLGTIRAGPEEKVLQSAIAAMQWRPDYSFGLAFWTARDAVPAADRIAALEVYLHDPADGATAIGLAQALARLQRGELLSAASTALLLDLMARAETGPMRLKAGLGEGWSIGHKTGTGQVMGELATGFNDVGLLTAPDGRVFSIAVLIASTQRPVPERQALMAEVARAVVAAHDPLSARPALPTGS